MASPPSVPIGNGMLLGLSPTELLRELQDSNMLEFAVSTGVMPVKMEGATNGGPLVGQHADAPTGPNGTSPMGAAQQQQQQRQQQQHAMDPLQQPQQSQPMDTDMQQAHQPQSMPPPQLQQQQQLLQQQQASARVPAMEVGMEVDAAAAEAERALAQARGTVAVLAGFDPQQQTSSRSASFGQGTMAATEQAGTTGVVRRAAARRGTRGIDQGYGESYGAYVGGGGVYGAMHQVGPLGFAPSERTGGKQGKGLRHFSMKVCEKVESKGTTTYNEVADELVAEMKDSQQEDGVVYDEKNIRRRVYDAINVLMALDVIAKEKKAIIWRGFNQGAGSIGGGGAAGRPTVGPGAIARAQDARATAAAIIDKKAAFLADLLEQQRAIKALLARNAGSSAAAAAAASRGTHLELPFILVQAKPDATVEVQISDDMRDVQFDFSNAPFQIHDDSYVLRMMAEETRRRAVTGEAVAAAAAAAAAAVAAQATGPPAMPGAPLTQGAAMPYSAAGLGN